MTTDATSAEMIEEAEQLRLTGQRLLALIREGGFEQRLVSIMEQHLAVPRAPDTVDLLKQSLFDYTEDENTSVIILTATSFEGELGDVTRDLYGDDQEAHELVKPIFRRLRSSYKARLQAASDVWGEDPDDWRNITSDVTYSFSREVAMIRLRLELNTGEVISLNTTSNGVAKLVGYLIERVADLPPDYLVTDSDTLRRLTVLALGTIGQFADGTPVGPDDLELIMLAGEGLQTLDARARTSEQPDAS